MQKESNSCIVQEGKDEVCLCPLEGIIEVISRKWTLQIVATLGNHGTLRYNELMNHLRGKHGGISPRTLTDRLKDLEGHGLISREAFMEIPPRVEYSLTPRGQELKQVMIPLMNWAVSASEGMSSAPTR
ncbi:MAG: winged helix-turn-helix transcriptional regulator [Candidatus Heimdallarchaeota archaeon]